MHVAAAVLLLAGAGSAQILFSLQPGPRGVLFGGDGAQDKAQPSYKQQVEQRNAECYQQCATEFATAAGSAAACERGCRLFALGEANDPQLSAGEHRDKCAKDCATAYPVPVEQHSCQSGCRHQRPKQQDEDGAPVVMSVIRKYSFESGNGQQVRRSQSSVLVHDGDKMHVIEGPARITVSQSGSMTGGAPFPSMLDGMMENMRQTVRNMLLRLNGRSDEKTPQEQEEQCSVEEQERAAEEQSAQEQQRAAEKQRMQEQERVAADQRMQEEEQCVEEETQEAERQLQDRPTQARRDMIGSMTGGAPFPSMLDGMMENMRQTVRNMLLRLNGRSDEKTPQEQEEQCSVEEQEQAAEEQSAQEQQRAAEKQRMQEQERVAEDQRTQEEEQCVEEETQEVERQLQDRLTQARHDRIVTAGVHQQPAESGWQRAWRFTPHYLVLGALLLGTALVLYTCYCLAVVVRRRRRDQMQRALVLHEEVADDLPPKYCMATTEEVKVPETKEAPPAYTSVTETAEKLPTKLDV